MHIPIRWAYKNPSSDCVPEYSKSVYSSLRPYSFPPIDALLLAYQRISSTDFPVICQCPTPTMRIEDLMLSNRDASITNVLNYLDRRYSYVCISILNNTLQIYNSYKLYYSTIDNFCYLIWNSVRISYIRLY